MKSILEFITEKLNIKLDIKQNKKYQGGDVVNTVTLVSRDVDCSTITKEQFIKYIREDFNKATEAYNENIQPVLNEYLLKNLKDKLNKNVAYAEKYAKEKYKRESSAKKYIDKIKNETIKNRLKKNATIDNFRFYYNESDTIPEECIIREQYINSNNRLSRAYQYCKESKYFNESKGWEFKFDYTQRKFNGDTDYSILFGLNFPYISLKIDEKRQNEIDQYKREMDAAIAKEYEDTSRYFGD